MIQPKMFKTKHSFGNVKQNFNSGKTFLRGLTQQAYKGVDKFQEILNPAIARAQELLDSGNVAKARELLANAESLHPSIGKLGLTDKFDKGNAYARQGLDYAREGMSKVDQAMNLQHVQDVRRMAGAGYAAPKGPAQLNLPRIPRGSSGISYRNSVTPYY